MTTICLTFHIHHPYALKKYRFFDMGKDHAYYDDFANKTNTETLAENYYLETNQFLLDLMKIFKDKIKVNFAISGVTLQQFEDYSPELIQIFKTLANTGNVEFLGGTYAYSVAGLYSKPEYKQQINQHKEQIEKHFGLTPRSFCDTELLYSDDIGEWIGELGFETVITEDLKGVLGWKSGNDYYTHPTKPNLNVTFRSSATSKFILQQFADEHWEHNPLSETEIVRLVDQLSDENKVVQLHLPYQLLGGTYIREKQYFVSDLMELIFGMNIDFATISEASKKQASKPSLNIPRPISSLGEIKELNFWAENELQKEAIEKLYALESRVIQQDNPNIFDDWSKLQAFDHFVWMQKDENTKGVDFTNNPYENAYDAFMNYMNILNDFSLRLGSNNSISLEESTQSIKLKQEIAEKDAEIQRRKKQLKEIRETAKKLQKQIHKK